MTATTIAKDIAATEKIAQYDASAKRLLANKIILAHIMHETMDEYKNCSIEDIQNLYIEGEPVIAGVGVHQDTSLPKIKGANVESTSINEGKITYDIRFDALLPKTEEPIYVIVNVEMQKHVPSQYAILKRALYYCARMLSAQYETVFTNSDYDKLRKVYSIWIVANNKLEAQNTISRYAVREEQLIGNYKEDYSHYDMLNVVLVRLGKHSEAKSLLRLLDVYFSHKLRADERKSILSNEYSIPMGRDEEENNMCNLGEGIYEDGVKQGLTEGKLQMAVANIVAAMENCKWTEDEAIANLIKDKALIPAIKKALAEMVKGKKLI